MKLQTKLILFQVLLLILVLAIAQTLQYKKMTHAVSAFSAANLQVMRDREERAAKNIFYSVNHAVAGSLERGEMEKFSRLLEDQRQLEGLLEFSLQDRKGVVTHSTDRRLLATTIPEDVKTQLFDKPEMLLKWNQDDVEIYKPLRVSNDCIRCHTGWNRDDIGGIVHFRFSKAAITTAETQAAGILSSMKSTTLKSAAFSLCGIVLVLAVAMHFLIKKLVGAPLRKINLRLNDIAEGEGDLTARIQVTHADEIGSLAISFNIFVEKLQEMVKNIAENAVMLSESSSDLSDMSGKMSEDSDQMSRRSKTAAEAASVMNSSMRSVALTMEDASSNIATVASATEEMNTAITSIVKRTTEAHQISEDAVLQTRTATEMMNRLSQATHDIQAITESIAEISEQTNLLALNATIESARAGEAGKGFAVVANEIKALAKQTADSTQKIKQKNQDILQSTGSTVDTIEGVSQTITRVNDIVSNIEAIMKTQSESTHGITDNIGQASRSIQTASAHVSDSAAASEKILETITTVNKAADHMSRQNGQVNTSSGNMNRKSEDLKELVNRFTFA